MVITIYESLCEKYLRQACSNYNTFCNNMKKTSQSSLKKIKTCYMYMYTIYVYKIEIITCFKLTSMNHGLQGS